MLINDLYTNKTPAVTEANDPNFVGFMNNTLGDRVDAKPEQPKTGHDWYDNAPTMSMDNMPSYKHAFKFGMSVLQSMDAETKQHFAEADNDELFSYLMKLARKKKFEPKYFVEEDMFEVTGLFSEIFHDPSMQDWEWADLLRSTLNNQDMTESMEGQVVFSGTGADGSTYEIIQSGPTDFMIHANGKHIDTYGSLQRAMSVLKNEVPGLQQGVAEGTLDEAVGMMIKGAAISGANDQDIADRIAAKTGGRVDSGSYGHHVLITYPTTQHRAEAAVKIRKMFPGIELYKSGGNRNAIDEQGMAEGSESQLDINQLAAISDAALDAAYGYGRSSPGNTFGWQANLKSAAYAKQMIDRGVTDIEVISDAIHKGWNVTAKAFVQDPNQFDDTEKLKAAGKLEAKLQQREKLMNVGYGQLPDDEQEKDRVVARALLQALTGQQGVAEAQTDYQKRRQRERDVDAGKPVKPEPKNPQNDYFARRKKEKDLAEDDDAVAAFMARGGEIQRLKSAKPRKGERWQGSAHIGAAGGRGTKGRVSGFGANTGKSGKPVVTAEDAAYDPFADDPAADAKHEADVFAKMKQQQQQGKGTKIKDMDPIDRDQYLKNTNRQWDDKTQRIVPATKPNVQEVSLGDYRKKAMMSKAMAQTDQFFGRDDPEKVAAADKTIANRDKGMARADARRQPYTAPPVDQDKQRRDLADKYPNIDELVRRAELNRDPQYDRADGQAYYNGRDAEHNYHKLKQIQRMIRGAELDEMDEMDFGVNQTTDSDTGDVTTNFNQGPLSVSQTKTPGGYTKQTDQQFDLGTATLGAKTVGPNIGAGQLAGTTTKTSTNTATGQAKQQVKGVGFGGASGATVGKNYVGASDDELAKHAADSATGINEEPGQITASVPGASFTADKSTNTLSGTTNVHGVDLTATRNMTPGGATTFSASTNVIPNLNIAATQKSADYTKGQLAGTKSVAAKYTDTTGALGQPGQQHTATRTAGVGFGGASGANVGKNYVDQYSVNESVDRIRYLAGIKPVR